MAYRPYLTGLLAASVVGTLLAAVSLGSAAAAPTSPGPRELSTLGFPDSTSAPTADAAASIAAKFGHAVRVDSETTPTELVSALPDGTMQMQESAMPVRVRRAGRWVAIDTSLVKSSDGMLGPIASPAAVEFSSGGAGPAIKAQTESGTWVSLSWSAGALPAPMVSGSTATYAEVFQGTDLVLTATATGISEVLVVKSAAAAENDALKRLKLGLDLAGLRSNPLAGGGFDILQDDSPVLRVSQAAWWDSRRADASAQGPGFGGATRPVSTSATDTSITVDATDLASAADGLTYPVYLDPQVSTLNGGLQQWTFVDSAYPTQSYWHGSNSDGLLHAGYIDAANSDDGVAHTTRAFLQMNSAPLAGNIIVNAKLNVTEVWSSSCTARAVQVWSTGQATSSTTWNNQPTWFNAAGASMTNAYGWSAACPATQFSFDVLSAAQTGAAHSDSFLTFGLRAASETDWLGWKKFQAAATLVVTYDHPPSVPTAAKFVSPSLPCVTSGSYPHVKNDTQMLKMQVTQHDADVGTDIAAIFHWYVAGTTTEIGRYTAHKGDNQPVSGQIAAGLLNAYKGQSMTWVATSDDGYRETDAVDAQHCHFVVDNTAPAVPTVTSTFFDTSSGVTPSHFVGEAGSVTLSSTDPTTVKYVWSYSDQQPSTPPACGTSVGNATTVCVSAGASATVSIEAISDTFTITAWALDAANNFSGGGGTEFYAQPNAVSGGSAHYWQTDGVAGSGSTVTDSPTATTPAPLGLSSSTSGWDSTPGGHPNLGPGGGGPALSFDGSTRTAAASTTDVVVDATHSVTVAGWLEATGSGGVTRTAISEDGTNISGFLLQISSTNVIRFCMPTTSTATWTADCVNGPTVTGTLAGQWFYAVGIWDAVGHVLRLRVNGVTYTPLAHTMAAPTTSSVVVGRAKIGTPQMYWLGDVENPAVFPGILTDQQIDILMKSNCQPGATAGCDV
jgi:hypothetical protein